MNKTESLKLARKMVGPLVRWGHNDWRFSTNDDGRGWRESRGRGYFSAHAARGEMIREIAADIRRTAQS